MKTIIYSILLIFISTNGIAQNANLNAFTGVWTWEENNKTFTVELYSELDTEDNVYVIKGHYKMEETINGTTTLIYNSNKYITTQNGVDYFTGWTIYGGTSNNPTYMGGSVTDNVLWGDDFHTVKNGNLAFEIISTNPTTATWKVSETGGIQTSRRPAEFSIPTDIVLTKQ